MATLYKTDTTLQDILGMKVGDELKVAGGGDVPEYDSEDAGKALQVNSDGTGLEWGPGVPEYTAADAGKVLTVENPTETVTIAAEQTFTAENGYGQMSVDFSNVSAGDQAVINSSVAGQPVTINMLAVEHDNAKYLIDAQYTEYDPTHGYLSEDGEFYNPSMASIPQVSITASVTATKTLEPTPVWGAVSHPVVFYPNTGSYLEGITVKEAFALFNSGNIIFTIENINTGSLNILTKITRTSGDDSAKYSVYWNFNGTATSTNLNGDDRVPVVAFH